MRLWHEDHWCLRNFAFIMLIACYFGLLGLSAVADLHAETQVGSAVQADTVRMPLLFVPGHAADAPKFTLARGLSSFGFFADRVVMRLVGHDARSFRMAASEPDPQLPVSEITLSFVGANADADVIGGDRSETIMNEYRGTDESLWRSGVPTYRRLTYKGLYEGIDLVFLERDGALSYEFVLEPGADPSRIRIAVAGATALGVNDAGDLALQTEQGVVDFAALRAYQPGNKEVEVKYEISSNGFAFVLGEYDTARPLVIDPTLALQLSTYWGGSGTDVFSNVVIGPSNGYVYMTGRTVSSNFPISGTAYQSSFGGGLFDVALFGYDPATNTVKFSSYFGGSGEERQFANSTAIDANGNLYLTGLTSSTDLPMTGSYDSSYNGGLFDGFMAKFSSSGSLYYSTYLGGSDDDQCLGIAANTAKEAYVACSTKSSDFPTASALDATYGGSSVRDITVTKFSSSGTSLIWSTYYGAGGDDGPIGITLDASSNPIVYGFAGTGITHVSPYQGTYGGSTLDGVIAKYAADGSSMTYSTYVGGNGSDSIRGLTVDSNGKMTIAMSCGSTNMATVSPFQGTSGGGFENYVAKFNVAGSALDYGSYYGGSSTESPFQLIIDRDNVSYVVGSTSSSNLPTTLPYQSASGGGTDIEFFALPPSGSALTFATYLGGSGTDIAQGIAIDGQKRFWIAAQSASTNFPQVGTLQSSNQGAEDAVMIRMVFGELQGGGGSPAPYLAVQEPNGFDSYLGGQTVRARWFVQSVEGLTAHVLLSPDAGKSFVEVGQGSMEGPIAFTVPYLDRDLPSKVRVELRAGDGTVILSDESDYYFTIKRTAEPIRESSSQPVMPEAKEVPSEPLVEVPPPVGEMPKEPPSETIAPMKELPLVAKPAPVRRVESPIVVSDKPLMSEPPVASLDVPTTTPKQTWIQSFVSAMRYWLSRLSAYLGF